MLKYFKFYTTIIVLLYTVFCFAENKQENEKLKNWNPQNCEEIGVFATSVLDSSLFFKRNAVDLTKNLISDKANHSCEFYPLLLTIDGFQKYVSNNILESRYALLEADSIYNYSKGNENKFNIRNKIFLGLNYNVANDTIKSLKYLREALAMSEKTNNQKLRADAMHNIGVVYLNSDLIDKAVKYVGVAIKIAEQSGNTEIVGFANLNFSRIYKERNQFEKALEKVKEAEIVFKILDDQRNLYLIEVFFGEIYVEMKDDENAIRHFLKAEKVGNNTNQKSLHGEIYLNLGQIYSNNSEKKSIQYYEKALAFTSALTKIQVESLISMLSNYYLKINDVQKQNALVKNLTQFFSNKEKENRVELIASNKLEIEFQKEVSENKILQLKNESSKRRIQLIALASIICIFLGLNALFQLLKNKRLTNEISIQNQELKNRNIELKNFASIASHDLKAPVRSISGFTALIERLIPKDSDPKIFEYLEFIKSSSSNMNCLVNSLLEFSTLENRKLKINTVNVSSLFDDVKNNLNSLIEKEKAVISISKRFPINIKGDETLLKIVVQNLINNALKFVAKEVNPVVKVDYNNTEDSHLISFTDNGIGIETEYLEKIFLIFERLHSAQEYEGSGIGLATCKKIMQLHNGDITIESKSKKGSTFTLVLPKH